MVKKNEQQIQLRWCGSWWQRRQDEQVDCVGGAVLGGEKAEKEKEKNKSRLKLDLDWADAD